MQFRLLVALSSVMFVGCIVLLGWAVTGLVQGWARPVTLVTAALLTGGFMLTLPGQLHDFARRAHLLDEYFTEAGRRLLQRVDLRLTRVLAVVAVGLLVLSIWGVGEQWQMLDKSRGARHWLRLFYPLNFAVMAGFWCVYTFYRLRSLRSRG